MYSRSYEGRELHFETSGGLVNSSLVLQDRETDSYWSIMKGRSTAGPLRDTELIELPGTKKTRWAKWVARHPDTKVLSVRGLEHAGDGYRSYWHDPGGFRGQRASDRRLDTKAPIFAFEYAGQPYAIAHDRLAGGHRVELADGAYALLYRPEGAPLFESTDAFVSRAGFAKDGDRWVELESGARFDPERDRFEGRSVDSLGGFDTFWYTWSLNNPDTLLLE